MKVFSSKEFIKKLEWLITVPNYYYSANGTWCTYNWNNGKFMMDCVVSIKGLLWGFRADKNAPHGGGVYGSNGVADFGANQGIDFCENVSQDFSNLTPGEYLCMAGTPYDHAGVYLGNGKVFECTTGWGVNRCIISDIDSNGGRYYNGVRSLRWTRHGKLIYIDYTDEPQPTPSDKVSVTYRVKTKNYGWLPPVVDLTDFAGFKDDAVIGIAIKVDKGSIRYRVSPKNQSFLPYVSGYDINDFEQGFAGNNTPIDRLEIYYYTPQDIIKTSGYKKAKYRVNDLPWMYDNEPDASGDTFAGIRGKDITKVEIIIE